MAALNFKKTRELINLILEHEDSFKVRGDLYQSLITINSNEGQFYEGIAKHALGLDLTTEQWFKLLSLLPNEVLYSQLPLSRLLSEEQQEKLQIKERR